MKKLTKNKLIMIACACIAVIAIVAAVLLKDETVAKAEYSSRYTEVYGEFTSKTANKLLQGRKENTCYSPMSMFGALTLVAGTTEGQTQQEVLESMGVKSLAELEELYSEMLKDININTPTAKILLANSLWINKSSITDKAEDVIHNCKEKFDCEIFECDGIKASEINDWVSQKTNNLINDMAEENMFRDLALINTLYYKAEWFHDFSEAGKNEFKLEDGNEVTAEYIKCVNEAMKYKETDDYTVVGVPMKKGTMVFVLPGEDKKLDTMLGEDKLNEIMKLVTGNVMDGGGVTISLPKFEFRDGFGYELEAILQSMGVKSLFENSEWAVSEGMNGLPVNIFQKTYINVNEQGVEAAAATTAFILAGDDDVLKLKITLDRPFMYILINDGAPMFIGTVYNPVD